jgi:hypothetical protein
MQLGTYRIAHEQLLGPRCIQAMIIKAGKILTVELCIAKLRLTVVVKVTECVEL